ncbi:mandelate racemase/muconate lactonizing enzyme family protein [Rubrobacter indicoceani]|uniref:mandelate racemase/muconate lactonizing enzyme family protein n=1 Tax=Rubrobacter indicoceani TaxID=2051957 RepID=UPI000E5C3B6C|nr:mandelate racemase/muconate lactonizing enzyme family protein [Rubrobacter indicoceani]
MKITDVKTRRIQTTLEPPLYAAWDPEPRRTFDATLVAVETDEGLTGIGSGDTMAGFSESGFEAFFIGEDPLRMARHVRTIETLDFHAGRYWPLEAALWDLVGKITAQPVANLFGGEMNRVPAYASCGELKSPGARAESAVQLREEGFRAMKIRVDPHRADEGIASVAAAREAVGDSMEIMVDLNQAWRMAGDATRSMDVAGIRRIAARLRELDVFWLEEPLPISDTSGLSLLKQASGLRLAGGEMARTMNELLSCLDADALDVYQPDVVLSLGMMRARTFAELALDRNRLFTPHTWTNGIGLLANLHVTCGVGGGPYLEYPYDPPGWTPERRDFMLEEPVRADGEGYISIPEKSGLGVCLKEEHKRVLLAE